MLVDIADISDFVESLLALDGENDYAALLDSYGIRRTNPAFWEHYDRFSESFRKFSAIDYGVIDLNKLENR